MNLEAKKKSMKRKHGLSIGSEFWDMKAIIFWINCLSKPHRRKYNLEIHIGIH